MGPLEPSRASFDGMGDGSSEPPSRSRAGTIHLTPFSQPPRYTSAAGEPQGARPSWACRDPRSSSTQSLVPSEFGEPDRRTLLLVYIHGFLGNETSFQSFPAHVHSLLKVTLGETHVIHTKIYPRYRSRKAIEFARDDFSAWLAPHESETVDVILLGHSMGGLLSAEVVLLPPHAPAEGRPFRHRILGTINFDTPFLGLYPGIIASGIGSLFRPARTGSPSQGGSDEVGYLSDPSPAVPFESASANTDSQLSSSPSTDPNFNPPFLNDAPYSSRSGWDGALHFFLKYSGNLPTAVKTYLMSHLEFGGCLADYNGLKSRYAKIRHLEEIDDRSDASKPAASRNTRRVRFANYYTASTGRLKQSSRSRSRTPNRDIDASARDVGNQEEKEKEPKTTGGAPNPRISVEFRRDSGSIEPVAEKAEDLIQDDSPPEILPGASVNGDHPATEIGLEISNQTSWGGPLLPPVPVPPEEPPFFDASQFSDKDALKLAEKEHSRVFKAYKQAVKDYSKAIRDRRKLIEKLDRKARVDRERKDKYQEKERAKEEKEGQLHRVDNATSQPTGGSTTLTSVEADKKHPRDRRFCILPPKIAGEPDTTWIRVFMEGVDEVGAHCGLFFAGQAYEQLVGDVGSRIEEWVIEEETRVAVRELEDTNSY